MNYTKEERCSGRVYDNSGFECSYQCQKKAVVVRDGKPYCKIHDPQYIKEKAAKKQAEWDKKYHVKRAYQELQNTAVSQCRAVNPNNPMAVAESIKDMYEALKANREWIKRFVMKFYIQAENPTYDNMKKLYQELNDFVETIGSEALAKVEGKAMITYLLGTYLLNENGAYSLEVRNG